MLYKCSMTEDVTISIDGADRLDPEDFIWCSTIGKLKESIMDTLLDSTTIMNIDILDSSNLELDIPEGFIKEWKELVTKRMFPYFASYDIDKLLEYIKAWRLLVITTDKSGELLSREDIINNIIDAEISAEED